MKDILKSRHGYALETAHTPYVCKYRMGWSLRWWLAPARSGRHNNENLEALSLIAKLCAIWSASLRAELTESSTVNTLRGYHDIIIFSIQNLGCKSTNYNHSHEHIDIPLDNDPTSFTPENQRYCLQRVTRHKSNTLYNGP